MYPPDAQNALFILYFLCLAMLSNHAAILAIPLCHIFLVNWRGHEDPADLRDQDASGQWRRLLVRTKGSGRAHWY